ncbi:MAG: methylmalonyl Co-A mutase-associated GTPase MeaB [Bacteroidales bacterium]|nr:methylmalonyl Co-A mutase-associated GTPase MeaB [Bacteroidales bacterium]
MPRLRKNIKPTLYVKKGVKQVNKLDEDAVSKFSLSKKKNNISVDSYVKGILNGNISILSQAITLVESAKQEHREYAQKIINSCIPYSGKSVRVGITGVPGVGKSTFIEALGVYLIERGNKVAVLAIDPSSEKTRGSILGDKTRMTELSSCKNAFIRPSPSSGTLGGVARKTAETIVLCEAAGYNIIFIETVGVGQSEIAVNSMVDFFLLLMLAGAGDELQGIKRGITEMADTIVINKADGDNIQKSELAKTEYKNALHLFPRTESNWQAEVKTASAITGSGISDIWDIIKKYELFTKESGFFETKRNRQAKYRMYEAVNEELKLRFYSNNVVRKKIKELEKELLSGKISPYFAAQTLLDL